MRPISEIRDAVSRLHSAAWHGRGITPGDKPRFSVPRQATDDDEVAYAALEELAWLRGERARIVAWLRQEASAVAGTLPVSRGVAANAIADWIEQGLDKEEA